MAKIKIFYGWWIVLSIALITFWMSGYYWSFTTFVKPISEEFGWSIFLISLATSFRSVEMGILAPITGILTDRYGPRRVVFFSGFMGGLGFILMSQINSLPMYYFASIVAAIASSGLSQSVLSTAVANWFHKKVGKATGIAIIGYGAGGILMPVVVWLTATYGWRQSFMLLGISTWLTVLPLSLVLRHRPEKYGYLPDGESPENVVSNAVANSLPTAKSPDMSTREALKTATFWLFATMFAIYFMMVSTVTLHIMPRLDNAGITVATASLLTMSIPLFSVVGRVFFGWLGDILPKKLLLAFVFFMAATGLVFFMVGKELWQFALFTTIFGVAYGGLATLRSAVLRDYFGRTALGSIHGWITAIMTLGSMIGPALAGYIYDRTGDYQIAWIILIVAAITGMICALCVQRVKTVTN